MESPIDWEDEFQREVEGILGRPSWAPRPRDERIAAAQQARLDVLRGERQRALAVNQAHREAPVNDNTAVPTKEMPAPSAPVAPSREENLERRVE